LGKAQEIIRADEVKRAFEKKNEEVNAELRRMGAMIGQYEKKIVELNGGKLELFEELSQEKKSAKDQKIKLERDIDLMKLELFGVKRKCEKVESEANSAKDRVAKLELEIAKLNQAVEKAIEVEEEKFMLEKELAELKAEGLKLVELSELEIQALDHQLMVEKKSAAAEIHKLHAIIDYLKRAQKQKVGDLGGEKHMEVEEEQKIPGLEDQSHEKAVEHKTMPEKASFDLIFAR